MNCFCDFAVILLLKISPGRLNTVDGRFLEILLTIDHDSYLFEVAKVFWEDFWVYIFHVPDNKSIQPGSNSPY